MCTEFILAILYFGIILSVNYFLLKLLISYYRSIQLSLRKKKILELFPENFIPWELFQLSSRQSLTFSISRFSIQDILISGYYYAELSKEKRKNTITEKINGEYYFELLKQQYLSSVYST